MDTREQVICQESGSFLRLTASLFPFPVAQVGQRGQSLRCAYLPNANFSHAKLSGANMYGAELTGANFSNADLRGANLENTNLEGANLSGADLTGANLKGAMLELANFKGARFDAIQFDEMTYLPDGELWTPETDVLCFTEGASSFKN